MVRHRVDLTSTEWLLLVIGAALPPALLVVRLAVSAPNARRKNERRVQEWKAALERSRGLAAGPVLVEAHVAVDAGLRVSLGSSIETDTPSHDPTLDSEEVLLETAGGEHVLLQKDKKLKVVSLSGARRELIDTITREGGVDQRYSFEVEPDKSFYVTGVIGTDEAADSPYRDVSAQPLEPLGERYEIRDELPTPPKQTHLRQVIGAGLACGAAIVYFQPDSDMQVPAAIVWGFVVVSSILSAIPSISWTLVAEPPASPAGGSPPRP